MSNNPMGLPSYMVPENRMVTPGNPMLIIHDGDTICEYFIDAFLEGFNVGITTNDEYVQVFVTGYERDPDDGFPMIVGYRVDEDFNWDEESDHVCIHWETVTKIEVW